MTAGGPGTVFEPILGAQELSSAAFRPTLTTDPIAIYLKTNFVSQGCVPVETPVLYKLSITHNISQM